LSIQLTCEICPFDKVSSAAAKGAVYADTPYFLGPTTVVEAPQVHRCFVRRWM